MKVDFVGVNAIRPAHCYNSLISKIHADMVMIMVMPTMHNIDDSIFQFLNKSEFKLQSHL